MVDQDDYVRKLHAYRPRVVVLIHYYGFPDPQLLALASAASTAGAKVLEDEAHALLTDWVGGICGRYGDATIASLHKLLPVPTGGLLSLNGAIADGANALVEGSFPPVELLNWDYATIAAVRRKNASRLIELLQPLSGRIDLLFDELPAGVAPQTLPVLIRRVSRDRLYFDLNLAGFGVVSLYHTLVQAISPEEFPDSYQLARQVMNLPVHQDVRPEQLEALVEALERQT
jgi:dTDP-4-amino-4,6-dideoxygalactose transaminase